MYGAFGPCQNYRLVSLDVNDGTTVYDKPIKVPSILGISNVVYNSQYVYFGYKGSKAVEDSTIGSGGISAYTVEAGEPVWTYTISGASLVRSIVASDSYLAVDGGTDKYYLLNASTGNVIKTLEKKFEPGTPIGPSVNFAFWYDYILGNRSSGDGYSPNILFWSDKLDGATLPPLLLTNSLVIKRTSDAFSGTIVALDKNTGDILWETNNNVVSNVASDRSTLFFLTSSAQLVAVDVNDGTLLGSIQFTGGSVQMIEERGFFTAASGNEVFVYFGDSQQLFAFRFLPVE